MEETKYGATLKIFVALSYLIMITVNGVGNLLPLNNQSTGQISDAYPNLFAPAGITFSIWGVIYFLLACYTLYQFGLFQKSESASDTKLMKSIAMYFIISSFANAAWIFSWHYLQIPISMVLMVVILICLILVNKVIKREKLTQKEKFFLRLPFSIYYGWITVATIANFTVLLVSLGWNGWGLSDATWASIIIPVGMLIGGYRMLKDRDVAYGLVLIWAYLGILFKHTSANGFSSQYPNVIISTVICIVLLSVSVVYIILSNRKKSIA